MAKRANPVTIGIFVTGAFILFTGLLGFLGTAGLFDQKEQFIMFFDESVNGLNVGSAVKFKGVPIGRVKRILIRAENQPESSSAVPVIIELDGNRLSRNYNVGLDLSDPNAFADQIANGLRARLNSESFITGLLYVDLDYVEDIGPPRIIQDTFIFKEIPTVPSTVAELTEQAFEAIATFSQMDFEGTLVSLKDLLDTTQDKVAQVDVPRLTESITGAADSFRDLAQSEELQQAIVSLNDTLVDVQELSKSIQGNMDTLGEDVAASLENLNTALGNASETLGTISSTLRRDSRLMVELEAMMKNISKAATSTQALVEFLERNPKALISGRPID
jgi:paraquat-inducible protein B